ncbi:hypothetical protein ABIE62_002173 [Porphyrobacter sp. MBR-155]|jgi:hypothetical protein|uniref:hypothetical protein n=1 Tax=Porphyrobacter sp. MBR-155 TaxID=3156464 RepID=UPI003399C3E1
MLNIWKAAVWAMLIIAVALAASGGVFPHKAGMVLVTALPILAVASLKGRNCCGGGAKT